MSDTAYQVFLSYNSADREFVRQVAARLKQDGVRYWFDEERLHPGEAWQTAIEEALPSCESCAVFLNAEGLGRWQDVEMRVALSEQVEGDRGFRLIPVLLPGADARHLPEFLKQLTWVEFQLEPAAYEVAYQQLLWGIRRVEPDAFVPPRPAYLAAKECRENISPRGLRSFDRDSHIWFLRLVPGPPERGLPKCLRFWKTKLEQVKPEGTFSVGLINGPSGCGKSSLVKAGLIPTLAEYVLPIYVEASADRTETVLLRELRSEVANLPDDLPLSKTMAHLRDNPDILDGRKVVLFLDQFEQWLHAHRGNADSELAAALRCCDGARLQAVILVRTEFWGSVHRFLESLDVRIQEGVNWQKTDLFSPEHARFVLAEYGRAYRPPDEADSFATKPNDFLDGAVADLRGSDGRVVAVQIALLAETLKDRPWTPQTLHEIGGAKRVGFAFLEEAFYGRVSNPAVLLHRKAALAVLKALLPPPGVDIRGHSRAADELRRIAGYANRPAPFDELMRILDVELRIITPTEKPEADEAGEVDGPDTTERYQLTHDYLLPSLREWLTRKLGETWRGWATLCLEERAEQWSKTPHRRFLPTVGEYLLILPWAPRDNLTPEQRSLLRAAHRFYAQWAGGLFAAFLVLVCAVVGWWYSSSELKLTRRVDAVSKALSAELPQAIEDLLALENPDAPGELRKELGPSQRQKLNAALALAEFGEVRVDALVDGVELWSRELYPRIVGALRKDEKKLSWFRELISHRFQTTEDADAKARLATVGLHLGDACCARDVLARKEDPTLRTRFIVDFPFWPEDVPSLAVLLQNDDADFRSGLLAALALVPRDELNLSQLESLRKAVVKLYTEAPDAATHSAAYCVFKNWRLPVPELKQTLGLPSDQDWFVNGQGITLIRIPAGTFVMGDDCSAYLNEKPAHQVRIRRPFWVSDREVTRRLFERCVAETNGDANYSDKQSVRDWTPLNGASPDLDCPASSVSWLHSIRFCNWLSRREGLPVCYEWDSDGSDGEVWECKLWAGGYRLPTEAEWEYTCRARTTTRFSCGDDETHLRKFAWLLADSNSQSWPAGQKLPNAWGLFDMHGNLWEWCNDWYGPDYYKRLAGGSKTNSPPSPLDDPSGPKTGRQRVYRGGSRANVPEHCHSAYRNANELAYGDVSLGFRVVAVALSPSVDATKSPR